MTASPAPDQDGTATPGDPASPARADPVEAVPAESAGSAGPPWYPAGVPVETGRARRTGTDRLWVRGVVGAATAVVVGLLGFPLGWLWHTLAPSLPVLIGDQRQLFLADVEGEQRAGAEGTFILLAIGTGLVVAIVAWIALRRFRGPVTAAALAVGGIGAGWLAWRFGHTIGLGDFHRQARTAPAGSIIHLPPDLRIKQPGNIGWWHHIPYLSGDLLYVGITALLVYLLIAGFSLSPSLGTRRGARHAAEPGPGGDVDRAPGGAY